MRTFKFVLPLILGIFVTFGLVWVMANAGSDAALGNVIYVDPDATGSASGLSWTDAYTNLQDALTIAISGTQIWVAEGIYYPDEGVGQTNNAVTSTFVLKDGVVLYGGFGGYGISETLRTQRDWEAHVTVLSGDLGQDDITESTGVVTNTDNITGTNSYHVVSSSYVGDTTVLDGFTVTAGKANGDSPNERGGGLYIYSSNPTLYNLTFSGNAANNGGGVGNFWYSNPSLTNVTFSNNSAGSGGGGMYNHTNSNSTLTNVTFSGNSASNYGGGMFNYSSSPTLTNLIFSGNLANFFGGGIYNNSNSDPVLMNVTFSGNSADTGGGIYNFASSNPKLTNVILWGNIATITVTSQISNTSGCTPVISSTLIQDSGSSGGGWDTSLGTDGGGNIDADPLFVRDPDPGDGDWSTLEDNDYGDLHLQWGSPAIDAGTNTNCPATDLDGIPRAIGPFCDMGAFELIYWRIFLPLLQKTP